MWNRIWVSLLATSFACASMATPAEAQGRARGRGLDGNPGTHRNNQDKDGRGRGSSSRIYQDPAGARGYEAGFDLGQLDGRDGERYDPVRHRDYRDADRGYASSYGSRDGYKSNFRAGFRQGYEDGYREGTRKKK